MRIPDGYRVAEGFVPPDLITRALRRIYLEFRGCPITPDTVREWDRTTWFPGIRGDAVFTELLQAVRAHPLLHGPGTWAEPQLLVRLPDWEEDWTTPSQWHVDELPPWADGTRYRYEAICQVALTDAGVDEGCLYARDPAGNPQPVPVRSGDVVIMHPDLPHAGSPNRGATPRVAVYLRLMTRTLGTQRGS